MWKLLSIFAVCVTTVWSFDYLEFQRKYCYEDTDVRTTDYYFPYQTGYGKTLDGYVCENFILTKADLDYMARNSFVLSRANSVFLKNCEIEYFNEYLVSRFPNVWRIFFENCKLSLKDPDIIATTAVSSIFHYLGFHKCNILDNLKSSALQKLTEIHVIIIQNTTFQYPRIDEHFLPKVNSLYFFLIDNSNLKTFHRGLLSNAKHYFDQITCTSCQLEEIDSLLYGMNYDIHHLLMFNDNSITKLPTSLDLLANLRSLPELHLQGNQISEPLLKRIYFKSMPQLRILDLSRNANITGISYLAFKDTYLQQLNMSRVNLKDLAKLGNRNLTRTDLSHNQISLVPTETFEGLIDLYFLDISFNKIKELQSAVFKDLRNLDELRLNSNEIIELPSNIFIGLNSLRILDLSNNFLDRINGLETLTKLQELRIHNNFLKTIPSGQSFPSSLRFLDISSNPVNFVGRNCFSNLAQLTSLDISYTNRTYLDFDKESFQPLSSLKTLKLTGNYITAIEDIYLPRSLQNLDLSNNKVPVVTNKGLDGLVNLENLNLANNHIYVIEKDVMRKLSKIKFVDLSGNDL